MAATALLLAAARVAGLSWAELGLHRRALGAGLRCGGACAALVAAGLVAGVAIPAIRPVLFDARAAAVNDLSDAFLGPVTAVAHRLG